MKKLINSLLLILLFVSAGCHFFEGQKQKPDTPKNPDGIFIHKSYYGNDPKASVEWEISAKIDGQGQTIRHGESIRYSRSGKVYEKVNYANNKKEGKRLTYHSTGVVWKEQSYLDGKLDGLCKRYDRNGKLSAEYSYKAGLPAVGLKEFTNLGIEREQPTLKIEKIDEVRSNNRYILNLSLTGENLNRIKSVDFYTGDLIDGKYFHKNLTPAKALSDKSGEFTFGVPKGTVLNKTFNIVAVAKNVDGLTLILQKEVSISVRGV